MRGQPTADVTTKPEGGSIPYHKIQLKYGTAGSSIKMRHLLSSLFSSLLSRSLSLLIQFILSASAVFDADRVTPVRRTSPHYPGRSAVAKSGGAHIVPTETYEGSLPSMEASGPPLSGCKSLCGCLVYAVPPAQPQNPVPVVANEVIATNSDKQTNIYTR